MAILDHRGLLICRSDTPLEILRWIGRVRIISTIITFLAVSEESTMWNAYFDETPPKDYSFIGFYEHRKSQPDFTFSFRKESHKIKKDLASLMKDGSAEMKNGARQLDDIHKAKLFSFSNIFLHCRLA